MRALHTVPTRKVDVERAIRDVREGFFAARTFTTVEDLNAQARAWCLEIAEERRVPDAKDKTVAQAFLEERPRMIELPGDDFPVEEHVEVRVGKTPYVRFDRNDYSVPHTHVERDLTVLAADDLVRIVDPLVPTEPIAEHRRSFDRDQRIEHEGHVRALVEQKHALQPRASPSYRRYRALQASQQLRLAVDEKDRPHPDRRTLHARFSRRGRERGVARTEWRGQDDATAQRRRSRAARRPRRDRADGDSYRLREAEGRQRERAAVRRRNKDAPKS